MPSPEKRTIILPKFSPQNTVHKRPLEEKNFKKARLTKENFLPRGFSGKNIGFSI